MEVRYVPNYTAPNGATGTVLSASGAIAPFHVATTGTPTSINEVIQNAAYKIFHSHKPVVCVWKMRGSEEAQWVNTDTSSYNHGGFKWYIEGLDLSELYGQHYITWLVEFRGRK